MSSSTDAKNTPFFDSVVSDETLLSEEQQLMALDSVLKDMDHRLETQIAKTLLSEEQQLMALDSVLKDIDHRLETQIADFRNLFEEQRRVFEEQSRMLDEHDTSIQILQRHIYPSIFEQILDQVESTVCCYFWIYCYERALTSTTQVVIKGLPPAVTKCLKNPSKMLQSQEVTQPNFLRYSYFEGDQYLATDFVKWIAFLNAKDDSVGEDLDTVNNLAALECFKIDLSCEANKTDVINTTSLFKVLCERHNRDCITACDNSTQYTWDEFLEIANVAVQDTLLRQALLDYIAKVYRWFRPTCNNNLLDVQSIPKSKGAKN